MLARTYVNRHFHMLWYKFSLIKQELSREWLDNILSKLKMWISIYAARQFLEFNLQFSSVTLSCLTLCDPMNCSTPGFLVFHYIPEFAQTHVHWVDNTIHLILCCPLLLLPSIFPSFRVFSSESALHIRWPKYWSSASASALPMNIQDWFPLGLISLISLQSKGLSRVFSNTTVQKHQFFSAQLSLWSNSHIHTWPLETP